MAEIHKENLFYVFEVQMYLYTYRFYGYRWECILTYRRVGYYTIWVFFKSWLRKKIGMINTYLLFQKKLYRIQSIE